MKKRNIPKVLSAGWSEICALKGEKVTLNVLTENAKDHMLNFQIYESRKKNKPIEEIDVEVKHPEVRVKWKVAYKPAATEYGNPEFKFKARIARSSKTSKTLYLPADLEIAFTFDDGPAPKENPRTKRILDTLKQNKINATFFVEHKNILDEYRQELLKRMVKEGHNIGIHGVDPGKHHLSHQDTPEFKDKLKAMKKLIKEKTEIIPVFIRPPYGWGGWERGRLFSRPQLRQMYRELDMIRVNGWEAEIGRTDFWVNVEGKIEKAAKGNAQKLIILAHDLREHDAANLSKIINGINDRAAGVKVKVKYLNLREFYK